MKDELIAAYAYQRKHHRPSLLYVRHGSGNQLPQARAQRNLDMARDDVANGIKRYASMKDIYEKPWVSALQKDGTRYFENPAACGFREYGKAHDVAPRAVEHSGWFIDGFQDETICGGVFLLPGRKGQTLALPGVYEPQGGASIYMRPEYIDAREGELDGGDFRDIAVAADRLAEASAEKMRGYNQAYQAGARYAQNREDVKAAAKECHELRQALRTLPAGNDKAREAVETQLTRTRASMRETLKENAKLKAGEYDTNEGDYTFYSGDAEMIAAFNDGAGN